MTQVEENRRGRATPVSSKRGLPATPDLSALNEQVRELCEAGRYAKPIRLAKQALVRVENLLGSEHPRCGHRAKQPSRT
jgi:hypothetical protein